MGSPVCVISCELCGLSCGASLRECPLGYSVGWVMWLAWGLASRALHMLMLTATIVMGVWHAVLACVARLWAHLSV